MHIKQMKIRIVLYVMFLCACISTAVQSQTVEWYEKDALGESNYLTLTPDVLKATVVDGIVTIPFVVDNNCEEDVSLEIRRDRIDGLMTLDDTGKKVSIESYKIGHPVFGGGPVAHRIILKPGESKTYNSVYPIETLAFIAKKNRMIFGVLTGRLVRTNQPFQSFSVPFPVPAVLATPSWTDLGNQQFLSIVPDLKEAEIEGGTFRYKVDVESEEYKTRVGKSLATSLLIPLKVTNLTDQSYVANVDSIIFFKAHGDTGVKSPPAWESVKAETPVLKPGESTTAMVSIELKFLEYDNYKQGDKIVVAIGGRVPNTNRIFESYSAPFELPPVPKAPSKIYPFPTPIRRSPMPVPTSSP